MEFPLVLGFGYGASKRWNTILWNFQGWSNKPKHSKVFSKIYVLNQPQLFGFFSGKKHLDYLFLIQWGHIKLFNHLEATMLPYCFTASFGMFMVAVISTNASFFRHVLSWFSYVRTLLPQKPLIQGPFYTCRNTAGAYHCFQSEAHSIPFLNLGNSRKYTPCGTKRYLIPISYQLTHRKKILFLCLFSEHFLPIFWLSQICRVWHI